MKASPVLHKSVLITGCSTGIGLAAARMLRESGWQVLPTARKPDDLAMLREEGFTPVELDVAQSGSVASAAEQALQLMEGKLGAVVNNAGFGQPGAMEDLTRDAMRDQFEVNVFGLQELTNRFVPVFRKQGYGRIVNVSSVLGRISLPFMGIYSASKFAVEAMSDAMRVELRGTGISVSIVEPGPIETAFRDTSKARGEKQLQSVKSEFVDRYRKELDAMEPGKKMSHLFMAPPEAVGLKITHALESSHPKRRYCVTFPAYAGAFMARFAPAAVVDWLMSKRLN